MTFRALLLPALLLTACGDPGPSPEEVAAKELDRACGSLYSAMTKVYRDELYKGGVAEVTFSEKEAFVEKCAASGLDKAQRRCMDPNLGGGEECKKTLKPVEEKATELSEFLLAPMKEGTEEPEAGAEEEAEE